MVYFIIKLVSFVVLKVIPGFTVYGAKNIPGKGPFILVSNHASYLDPLLIAASVNRSLHFITRETLLRAGVIGWVLSYANTIQVRRHERGPGALKRALGILKKGGVVAIFPEGTRSKTGKVKKAKAGVGFIIAKANVPVVPVYISGSFQAQPRGINTLKRMPVTVKIGRPFLPAIPAEKNKDLYQAVSDDIMAHIIKVRDAHYRGGKSATV